MDQAIEVLIQRGANIDRELPVIDSTPLIIAIELNNIKVWHRSNFEDYYAGDSCILIFIGCARINRSRG